MKNELLAYLLCPALFSSVSFILFIAFVQNGLIPTTHQHIVTCYVRHYTAVGTMYNMSTASAAETCGATIYFDICEISANEQPAKLSQVEQRLCSLESCKAHLFFTVALWSFSDTCSSLCVCVCSTFYTTRLNIYIWKHD